MDPRAVNDNNTGYESQEGPRGAPQRESFTSRHIQLQGRVTIEMETHVPVHATQLVASLQECSWLNQSGETVLRHYFKDLMKNHHTWRHVVQHDNPRTMVFDHDENQGCIVHCSVEAHKAHVKTIPNYVFSTEHDYISVQSLLRGALFVQDYETLSIKCPKATEVHASRYHCVKSWQLHADSPQRSLSIPITLKSSFKLKHIDVQARWMKWEKQDTKSIKLVFLQVQKKASDASVAGRRMSMLRRLSFKPLVSGESSAQASLEPDQLAPADMAQRWNHFVLEFRDEDARERFYHDHCDSIPADKSDHHGPVTSPSISLWGDTSSLWSYEPTVRTMTTSPPTSPDVRHSSKKEDSGEPTLLRLPDPVAHEYLRLGGPKSMPNVVTTTVGSPFTPAKFHKRLANAHNEFRVLRILRGGGDSSLSCDLEHCRLVSPPKYEAVSYCWGIEPHARLISGGNLKGFPISEHLWRALQRLRVPSKDRLVWVDALCIDQRNVDERNSQIALMRQIYTYAFRTIIWIGDIHGPARRTCARAFADDGDTELTLCVHPGLAETEHENIGKDLREDLQHLQGQNTPSGIANVWWRRLWCVQEFRFSTRSPSVYIGPHAVQWVHFCALFTTVGSPLGPFLRLQREAPTSFSELITMTGSFYCSDPRDRVFALAGMVLRAGTALRPDYRRSVIRVIEDACFYLIRESGTVDVLLDERTTRSLWGREQLENIMPTWIPDLTCLLGASRMIEAHKDNAGLVRDRPSQLPIVELSSPPTPLFSLDGQYDMPRALQLRVVYFDTIERRTKGKDIPSHQQSPNGSLIYNSLKERGHIIDQILNKLE